MNTIEYRYGPVVLYLYMNGEAMFQIQALDDGLPADQPDALARMLENTADGYEVLCRIAWILATQGELCRRYLQFSRRRIPEVSELLLLLSPIQLAALRSKVIVAINAGYEQAPDDTDGDIDTGLAELEKKNKTLTRAAYLRMATVNHIQLREALLLLTPGEVFAMFGLRLEQGSVPKGGI